MLSYAAYPVTPSYIKFLFAPLKVNLLFLGILKAVVDASLFFSDSMIKGSRNACKRTGCPLKHVKN